MKWGKLRLCFEYFTAGSCKVGKLSLSLSFIALLKEAAVKQTQDFKQLRNEKKILEKEFRKTQVRDNSTHASLLASGLRGDRQPSVKSEAARGNSPQGPLGSLSSVRCGVPALCVPLCPLQTLAALSFHRNGLMNSLNRKLKRVSIHVMPTYKFCLSMQYPILTAFPPMFLELRHIGTQISSDSYGSIDKSEYLIDFFLTVRYFQWLGRWLAAHL